jgi:flavin-dependent dehydrogenase
MTRSDGTVRASGPLRDGGRVAVVGGGPAGSLFAYLLLRLAGGLGMRLAVDVYEPREFDRLGPHGCNMCAGILSGRVLGDLEREGITLPETVVQNRIDRYRVYTSAGSVLVEAPNPRAAAVAVHRGGGPRGADRPRPRGLDGYLLDLAVAGGASHLRQRVGRVRWRGGRPEIDVEGTPRLYDLVVLAIGVNRPPGKLLEDLGVGARPAQTARAHVSETRGRDAASTDAPATTMSLFLLDIPGLDFAGVVPKDAFDTVCLLGRDLNAATVKAFFEHPVVRALRPGRPTLCEGVCHCGPRLNVREAADPFADRVVLIGDCGVTRLYKDGLGSAFRTARAAAWTVLHVGVAARDFRRGYLPVYRGLARDNRYGEALFGLIRRARAWPALQAALLGVVSGEQALPPPRRHLNAILWDLFTGDAPYRSITWRCVAPTLIVRVLRARVRAGAHRTARRRTDLVAQSR